MLQQSDFDPYYKWLGIRPQHQPPDHYRLLGLEPFETDRDVIRAAAERQAAHIQAYKIGPHSELSQRLLTEVSQAKLCLLDPSRKAEYDRALQSAIAPPPVPQAAPAAGRDDPQAIFSALTNVDVATARRARRRARRRSWGPAVAIGIAALLVAALAIVVIMNTHTPVPAGDVGASEAVKPKLPERQATALPPSRPDATLPTKADPPPVVSPKMSQAQRSSAQDSDQAESDQAQPANPPVTPPKVTVLQSEPPAGRPTVRAEIVLSSGRELRPDLLNIAVSEFERLFGAETTKEVHTFVLKSADDKPMGLFKFDHKTGLDGAALTVYPNGKPRFLLFYDDNHRDGTLRHWDETGSLVLASEYGKQGNKLGLTCLCQHGQPIYIQDCDVGRQEDEYLIEVKDGEALVISKDGADQVHLARFQAAKRDVDAIEAALEKDERRWRQTFHPWRERNDRLINPTQRADKTARDKTTRNEADRTTRQKKLDESSKNFKSEIESGRAQLMDHLGRVTQAAADWTWTAPQRPAQGASRTPESNGGVARPLLVRLRGTRWRSPKGIFEWTADGMLLHKGQEVQYGIDDDRTARIVFSPREIEVLVFDDAFRRFELFDAEGPRDKPKSTGKRID